jgi:NADPH2:quinone reductase
MAPAQMRAVLFDSPASDTSSTRVDTVDVPMPGPGEVLIRVSYAGVNFKDVMARRGDPGYVRAWPFVPGLEVAGVVHATGGNVDTPMVGQTVVALTLEAGLAEFATVDARLAITLGAEIPPATAAAVAGAPLSAALLVEDFGNVRAGETLLVHSAAGAVGHAAAQLARGAGAGVLIGSVGHGSRAQAAHRNGYENVVVRGPEMAETIRAVAAEGVDLVLDPQGPAMLALDLQIAAAGARIVLFGNAGGTPLAPLPDLAQIMGANVSLRGFSLAALAVRSPARVAATLTRVLGKVAEGDIAVDVTVLDGLDATPEAHQALAEGRGDTKYVVRVAK